jgi:hypothetical protein
MENRSAFLAGVINLLHQHRPAAHRKQVQEHQLFWRV